MKRGLKLTALLLAMLLLFQSAAFATEQTGGISLYSLDDESYAVMKTGAEELAVVSNTVMGLGVVNADTRLLGTWNRLKAGTIVTVYQGDHSWEGTLAYKVQYGNAVGYVWASLLTLCADAAGMPLKDHADSCPEKIYVKQLCDNSTAKELHDQWSGFSAAQQEFILTYLSWTNQTKLAELKALFEGAGVSDCDCGNGENPLYAHSDTCAKKIYFQNIVRNKSAEEIYADWFNYDKEVRGFIIYYLNELCGDAQYAEKLEALQALLNPALEEQVIEVSYGDFSVSVSGDMPVGATVEIGGVELGKQDEVLNELASFNTDAYELRKTYGFDLKIMLDGRVWQPENEVEITINNIGAENMEADKLRIADRVKAFHMLDDADTVDALLEDEAYRLKKFSLEGKTGSYEAEKAASGSNEYIYYEVLDSVYGDIRINSDGSVTIKANSFSDFYFTVDFTYNNITYSILGGSSILLSELFEILGIEREIAEAVNVYFEPEFNLVSIEQVEGDWQLSSHDAFTTTENLVIVFSDDTILTIQVTDAQGGYYWVKSKGNVAAYRETSLDKALALAEPNDTIYVHGRVDDVETSSSAYRNAPYDCNITIAADPSYGARCHIYFKATTGTGHIVLHQPNQKFTFTGALTVVGVHDGEALVSNDDKPLVRITNNSEVVVESGVNLVYGQNIVSVEENSKLTIKSGAVLRKADNACIFASGNSSVYIEAGSVIRGNDVSGTTTTLSTIKTPYCIEIAGHANVTMSGGEVFGATATCVRIEENGHFMMTGGEIYSCAESTNATIKNYGSTGPFTADELKNRFEAITCYDDKGNEKCFFATQDTANYGVRVRDNALFTMSGGSIYGFYKGRGVTVEGTPATVLSETGAENRRPAMHMSGGEIFSSFINSDGPGIKLSNHFDDGGIAKDTIQSWDNYKGAAVVMTGGKVRNNVGVNGGGVRVEWHTSFYMNGGEISGNVAYDNRSGSDGGSGGGGGVRLVGAEFIMKSGTINGNKSLGINAAQKYNGGGIGAVWQYGFGTLDTRLDISGGTISGNSALKNGGGIAATDKANDDHGYNAGINVTISGDANITGNSTDDCGGGIYVGGGSTVRIKGGTISNNTAKNDGGGVVIDLGSLELGNTGGTITGNKGVNGGGVYMGSAGGTATLFRGAVVRNNTATGNGGGLYFLGGGVSSALNLYGGTIDGNVATGNGGGVYVDMVNVNFGDANSVDEITISGNRAVNGAGLYLAQGDIAKYTVSIANGCIESNVASSNGGAIYQTGAKAETTLSGNGTIKSNEAANGGGLYINSGTLNVTGGVLNANNAKGTMNGTTASVSANNKGVGGGVYLHDNAVFSMIPASGSSVGIYGNMAEFAADDVYASGNGTKLNIPKVAGMNLGNEQGVVGQVDRWYEDYPTDEKNSAIISQINSKTEESIRYRNMQEEEKEKYVYDQYLEQEDSGYRCLAIGYQITISDLLVKKVGLLAGDTATFAVRNTSGVVNRFTLTGKDDEGSEVSVLVKGLFLGDYFVVEEGWSWRYTPEKTRIDVKVSATKENVVTFTNTRENDQWLDYEINKKNEFTGTNANP